MYLKEKQYKTAMILLCPVQGPWASSFFLHFIQNRLLLRHGTKRVQFHQFIQYYVCLTGASEIPFGLS